MLVKYNPCANANVRDAFIKVNEYTLRIMHINADGSVLSREDYEFDSADVDWPDIAVDTDYVILSAERRDGELRLSVRRLYVENSDISSWDGKDYVPL